MFKIFNRVISITLFISLIALNIATVTMPAIAFIVASAVGVVVGKSNLIPEFRTVYYRGEERLLADAVLDTTKRISDRTSKGAIRNVQSITGEAIPVAGITVVLGVSALELKDACDTMTDLRALELAVDPDAPEGPATVEVCGLKTPSRVQVLEAIKGAPVQAWETARNYIEDLPELKIPSLRDVFGGPPIDQNSSDVDSEEIENWLMKLKGMSPFN